MWGSWFGVTFGGLLVLLLIVAIAFGTSALLFPVLIALAIGGLIAFLVIARRVRDADDTATGTRNPRSGGAPASGEGSSAPTSSPGPAS